MKRYKLWGKDYVPRFSFILWLVYKRRLPTKDRIIDWGIQVESAKCEPCKQNKEIIDHLLFECPSTIAVWKEM